MSLGLYVKCSIVLFVNLSNTYLAPDKVYPGSLKLKHLDTKDLAYSAVWVMQRH